MAYNENTGAKSNVSGGAELSLEHSVVVKIVDSNEIAESELSRVKESRLTVVCEEETSSSV